MREARTAFSVEHGPKIALEEQERELEEQHRDGVEAAGDPASQCAGGQYT